MRAVAREMEGADADHEDPDRAAREEEDSDEAKAAGRGRGRGKGRGKGRGRAAKAKAQPKATTSRGRPRKSRGEKAEENNDPDEADPKLSTTPPKLAPEKVRQMKASLERWSPRKRTVEPGAAESLPSKRTKAALEKGERASTSRNGKKPTARRLNQEFEECAEEDGKPAAKAEPKKRAKRRQKPEQPEVNEPKEVIPLEGDNASLET